MRWKKPCCRNLPWTLQRAVLEVQSIDRHALPKNGNDSRGVSMRLLMEGLDPDFASELETISPLPEGCDF